VDKSRSGSNWQWWVLGVLLLLAGGFAAYFFLSLTGPAAASAGEPGHESDQSDEAACVEVVRPQEGGLERITTQPGSVQAYERARLYAAVSGYLKTQSVDIGDRVKKDQLLAKIDVPDLEKQVKQYSATVSQARARVLQTEARVATAKADLLAKQAKIKQAEAAIKTASAWLRFRQKQFERIDYLAKRDSIDGRALDESHEHLNAAIETENTAKAALDTARAEEAAAEAAIKQAEADVLVAKAEVEVEQARVEKAEVMVQFSEIRAPYDGVVTQLRHNLGAYLRAANESDSNLPLLTIERTDVFRVVVQVPDRDVPFCDPGDSAVVEIDALRGKKFPARVSRIAQSEDPQTRLMRVEIDLPNPTGEIKQGYYGRATIILDRVAGQLSLPSSCLVGKTEDGTGSVYVVRDRHVHLVPIKISGDNGIQFAVREGLTPKDQVVLHPNSNLADGEEVTVTSPMKTPAQH
jgi:HlyD family secretion protein